MSGLLLDENLPAVLARALHDLDPRLPVRRVGHGMAPPLGSQDPEILAWTEAHEYILVTDNRESMPVHLAAHLAEGRHLPGILQVPKQYTFAELAFEIVLTMGAALPGELADRIIYLSP